MWIMALLFWKRPRLAAGITLTWLAIMSVSLIVGGVGNVVLAALDPASPYLADVPYWAPFLAPIVGVFVLTIMVAVLAERSES